MISAHTTVTTALGGPGFSFVPGDRMHALLENMGSLADWETFAASWNDLAVDTYMGDGGRYRRRRYGAYRVDGEGHIARQPHQPHYQTLDYNHLNGGIERWFEPMTPEVGASDSMSTILKFCADCFGSLGPAPAAWNVEVHQFRIEARPGEAGKPTPEGMHRDGVDYVLVLMVNRTNILSGTTTICDLEKRSLGSFTLTTPFDAAIVDDKRVFHGVTPVEPIDANAPAYRDVLVVTFRRAAG
jgi:hypothetical protein